MKTAASVLTIFTVWPMSFFLTFSMLKTMHASDLMWLVFWAYIPVTLICALLVVLAEAVDNK